MWKLRNPTILLYHLEGRSHEFTEIQSQKTMREEVPHLRPSLCLNE
jgi:hypothetical protein